LIGIGLLLFELQMIIAERLLVNTERQKVNPVIIRFWDFKCQ